MDFGGNMFCLGNRDQNGNSNCNSNSFAWDSWEITTSAAATTTAAESSSAANDGHESGLANALMFLPQASLAHGVDQHHQHHHHHRQQQPPPPPYGRPGSHVHPDPHLTCLKLGKRHYFEDASVAAAAAPPPLGGGGGGSTLADKRGKGYCGGKGAAPAASLTASAAMVPRCQVERCHVALLNAKEYHRRHKVCEMHSKAPKVVVLGMEQRFCQQCSRFHVVSEFDDSKRSCRRRLAGHNERRRKSSHDSVSRNTSQGGCAFSLLSSRSDSWLSCADLSIRCSAALRELIAENRAAHMTRQLVSDRDWHLRQHAVEDLKVIQPESNHFPQHTFHQTQ